MSGHSTYEPKTGIERWLDTRLPIVDMDPRPFPRQPFRSIGAAIVNAAVANSGRFERMSAFFDGVGRNEALRRIQSAHSRAMARWVSWMAVGPWPSSRWAGDSALHA